MKGPQSSVVWVAAVVLAGLVGLGVWMERELDEQVITSLASARTHIEAITSLRRDVRKTHVALLERWVHPQSERARLDAEVRKLLDLVREEVRTFVEREKRISGEIKAADLLAQTTDVWSKRVEQVLFADEGPEVAPELRASLDRVTEQAELIFDLNKDLGENIDAHVRSIQTKRYAVQVAMSLAAFITLAVASRRLQKQRLAEERYRTSEDARLDLKRLAATLAHEVNNQLGVIQNTISLLGKKLPGEELLTFQQESVDSVKQMTLDFLSFGAQKIGPVERVDLVDLVQHVAQPYKEIVDVPSGDPVWLDADRHALSRAVLNLIKNGIEAGEHVEIAIERIGDSIRVTCKDDGPGIAPEHLDSVGEPFFTTKARGTGLGLTIVRQVAKSHGGTFSLTNVPSGRGAIATLWLGAPP